MNQQHPREIEFDSEADELDVAKSLSKHSPAVVSGTDWTTETIVAQLKRKNIQLNPRFQRRDAWKRDRKSRFIESLVVGLPIPQIVLAEDKEERGKFIVLDGKQRLLAIMQFWGEGTEVGCTYNLKGLTLRDDLEGLSFQTLSTDSTYEADYNALCNQPIRTVVIRNWKDTSFLHTVFLRLNTGSVTLSPQELRQALLPGPFTNYIDDTASESEGLRQLLGLSGPDPRMRDIEIMARFLAFHFFSTTYPGRMKTFLDESFSRFNKNWSHYGPRVKTALDGFESGIDELIHTFGEDGVARKPTSPQFNRAIFDALIYFHSQKRVRAALKNKRTQVKRSYTDLFSTDSGFLKAVESDTAGAPNTKERLRIWGSTLSSIAGLDIETPKIPQA